jgi:hypothetical protein
MGKASRLRKRNQPRTGDVARPARPAPEGVHVQGRHVEPPAGQIETLVGIIATGHLDQHLPLLTRVIAARHRQLREAASVRSLAAFSPGDRVRIGAGVRPLYLHGATGTVTGWSGRRVVVSLDNPTGRFAYGEVRVPALGLEPLKH